MREEEFIVPDGTQGRLDSVLTELLSQSAEDSTRMLSRSQVKKRIDDGAILLNGIPAPKGGMVVEAGDEIAILQYRSGDEIQLEPYEFPVTVLHEEEHFAVIDKPSGLTTHPGAGTGSKTLMNALVCCGVIDPAKFPGSPRPGIVHRLDKDTSGVMIIAKTPTALRELSLQFQERKTYKEYCALALRKPRGGTPFDAGDSGVIEQPIGRDPHNRLKMCIRDDGRSAVTEWEVLERMTNAFLLKLVIHSGRTHQIRVHLESVGSGVLGDVLYGNYVTLSQDAKDSIEILGRQALHAREIHFYHPIDHSEVSFQSEIPEDMSSCLKRLRGPL
ncbi:MAG: RluA family pseudouridine synthase [Bdellovibrionales bacterium]|nr:RluA family pseudouridine synthase [Bdellovibrionales bacterium]